MDEKEANPAMESYVFPLVISAAGILCSTLVIAVYNCILLRYFVMPSRLQRRNNRNRSQMKNSGVHEEILNKIPVFSISPQTSGVFHLDHDECSICLGQLEDGDQVRLLPACNHAFHRPCIDAWFKDHANCPICRSPITCDCELAMPISPQNVSTQQRVSLVSRNIPSDHHPFINDDVNVSDSTLSGFQHPSLVLLHSLSLSSHMQRKPQTLFMGLKRSLSMDELSSYILTTIQRDEGEASTSSSTKEFMMSQYNYRSRSLRHVDLMSSMSMTSFSQFQNSGSGRYSGFLPN
ncbi:RING-H2 finger protein ATL52-like [Abrus precatorius]|uniref:RING-type E3 ubiquitin transferase n=1 Tax=Abrus precatorius TaxID=3816 RepID=A0A8B8LF72_ABRPR|nr:RING-H2 finger protein ATL52-like [Abrus precatorius]